MILKRQRGNELEDRRKDMQTDTWPADKVLSSTYMQKPLTRNYCKENLTSQRKFKRPEINSLRNERLPAHAALPQQAVGNVAHWHSKFSQRSQRRCESAAPTTCTFTFKFMNNLLFSLADILRGFEGKRLLQGWKILGFWKCKKIFAC